MYDLVERFMGDIAGKSPTVSDYRKLLYNYFTQAKTLGINESIKFSFRRRRRKMISERINEEQSFNEFIGCIDDMIAFNKERKKNIVNKFKYWNKDVD